MFVICCVLVSALIGALRYILMHDPRAAESELDYLNRLLSELGEAFNVPEQDLYVHLKYVHAADGRHYRLYIPDIREDDQYVWSRFSSLTNLVACSRLWDDKKQVLESQA